MSQPYLGQIVMFGGNFAIRGYAFCNGQLLSISQNAALFSILGTTFGGNGVSTFALPDFRGRVPIHVGTGPGLSNYNLGQFGGTQTESLVIPNLPPHSHPVNAYTGLGTQATVSGAVPASGGKPDYYSASAPNGTMSPQMIGTTGSGVPFSILQPYLAVNFLIALQGIFPSRN